MSVETERPTRAFIEKLVYDAGEVTLQFFRGTFTVSTKAHAGDFLTEADLKSNEYLIAEIQKQYPHHAIISEETGAHEGNDWTWIIDPIDGTRNFATGTPIYGVMVALAHKGVVELAAVRLPCFNETISAERGKGVFLNGEPVKTSTRTELEHSFGMGFTFWHKPKEQIMVQLVQSVGRFQMSGFGCISMDIVYVASGRRDWSMTSGAMLWDYAPAKLILEEAGCVVTTIEGKPWTWEARSMVAANPALHAQLLDIIR